jgi:hypothetical protein
MDTLGWEGKAQVSLTSCRATIKALTILLSSLHRFYTFNVTTTVTPVSQHANERRRCLGNVRVSPCIITIVHNLPTIHPSLSFAPSGATMDSQNLQLFPSTMEWMVGYPPLSPPPQVSNQSSLLVLLVEAG